MNYTYHVLTFNIIHPVPQKESDHFLKLQNLHFASIFKRLTALICLIEGVYNAINGGGCVTNLYLYYTVSIRSATGKWACSNCYQYAVFKFDQNCMRYQIRSELFGLFIQFVQFYMNIRSQFCTKRKANALYILNKHKTMTLKR